MRGLGTAAGRSINLVSMPSQMAFRLMLFSLVLGLLVGCGTVFAESTRRIYLPLIQEPLWRTVTSLPGGRQIPGTAPGSDAKIYAVGGRVSSSFRFGTRMSVRTTRRLLTRTGGLANAH